MIGFNRFEGTIKIRYRASDGYSKVKTFKTLKGARKYCIDMLGKFPEIGRGYAVSGDGVGTIILLSGSHVELKDLFGNDVERLAKEIIEKTDCLRGVSFELDPDYYEGSKPATEQLKDDEAEHICLYREA